MQPDFYYYKNDFLGNIIPNEELFEIYKKRAENYILARVNVGTIQDDMLDCVCAIAEVFYEEESNGFNTVTSESIGGWKRTYDSKSVEKKKYTVLQDYLLVKGYLYCGL